MRSKTGWLAMCAAIVALMASSAHAQCASDTNSDGTVDINDLLAVLADWGACPACPTDITGDGTVDINDLLMLLGEWGPCPGDHLRFDGTGNSATCNDEATPACTDGHLDVPNEANAAATAFSVVGLRLSVPAETDIMGFNVVGGQVLPFWDDPDHTITINVHSTEMAFAGDPLNGDVHSETIDNSVNPTLAVNPPPAFGGTSAVGIDFHYLELNVTPFTLAAGEYIISFVPSGNRNFSYAETASDLGPDIWVESTSLGSFIELNTLSGATTGSIAADVLGMPTP